MGIPLLQLYSKMYRSGGSYPPLLSSVGGEGKSVSISVCMHRIHKTSERKCENENFFMGAIPPLPFPMSHAVADLYIRGLGGRTPPVGIHFFLFFSYSTSTQPSTQLPFTTPLSVNPPPVGAELQIRPCYTYVVVYVETCSVWTVVG